MSKDVAVLATVAAGGVVALQAPANMVLADHLGNFGAAVVSFTVGMACI
ncbi:MAG: DMT family transporter, partial [Thermoleophilaceae bacterium]